MPSPKHYFHCSHDIATDPGILELGDKFGFKGLLLWLHLLSRLDRADNQLVLEGKWVKSFANVSTLREQRCKSTLLFFKQKGWIVITNDKDKTTISAPNFLKYYRKRRSGNKQGANTIPSSLPAGFPPTPTPTPTPKKERIRGPVDTMDSVDNPKIEGQKQEGFSNPFLRNLNEILFPA